MEAVAYVVDQEHDQYRGSLALEDQARIIAGATGGRGSNDEYLYNTSTHLSELGISDPDPDWLATRVRALRADGG